MAYGCEWASTVYFDLLKVKVHNSSRFTSCRVTYIYQMMDCINCSGLIMHQSLLVAKKSMFTVYDSLVILKGNCFSSCACAGQ